MRLLVLAWAAQPYKNISQCILHFIKEKINLFANPTLKKENSISVAKHCSYEKRQTLVSIKKSLFVSDVCVFFVCFSLVRNIYSCMSAVKQSCTTVPTSEPA